MCDLARFVHLMRAERNRELGAKRDGGQRGGLVGRGPEETRASIVHDRGAKIWGHPRPPGDAARLLFLLDHVLPTFVLPSQTESRPLLPESRRGNDER